MASATGQAAWAPTDLPPHQRASAAGTLEVARVEARTLAQAVDADDRPAFAQGFGARMAGHWWRALTAAAGASLPMRECFAPFATVRLDGAAEALAQHIGVEAARLDAETAAYHIGATYTALLPRTRRAELGIYYTPPAITARLIAQATASGVDWATCHVLDPACGGGAFLAPVARRIMDELSGCTPRILIENIANRLRGYEIDPFGAWLSQLALDAVLLPVTHQTGRQLPVVVSVCDSLRAQAGQQPFDLVIGNPPYGRIRLAAADRDRFKRGLYGHANLYGLFTDLALHCTKPGGVVAYVTPTSFLAGEYFKNLRALLGRDAPPVTLDFISDRRNVFADVLQETLLATYKRGGVPRRVAVHEIAPAGGSGLRIERAGAFALPADPSRPWILPRCTAQAPVVLRLARMTHRLADWGYAVSTGPLVWNRHKDQLARQGGHGRLPLVWAESVTADGRFVWRAEKRNHAPWFELRDGDDWLVTRRPCVLLQRTTAKEQSRRLIAAALPASFLKQHGAAIVENHLNMLRPLSRAPAVPARALAAFLNSTAADQAFRCVSGSVAVSAYELEALPLPAPGHLAALTDLLHSQPTRTQIDAICQRIYDRA